MKTIESVSLLLASRARPEALRRTLASLYRLDPGPLRVQLVLVSSGCDRVAQVVRNTLGPDWLSIERLEVEFPGKSRAVNQGLGRCVGEVVVFSDDDVTFADDYFQQLLRGFQTLDCCGLQGGVRVQLEGPQPSWWNRHCSGILADTTGYPDKPTELNTCNAVLTREAVDLAGPWPLEYGPGSAHYPVGVDTVWTRPLHEKGLKFGLWEPMLVHHHIPASRMGLRPLMRRSWQNGVLQAHLEKDPPSAHRLQGLTRQSLSEVCQWLFRGDADAALWSARHCGYLVNAVGLGRLLALPRPGWKKTPTTGRPAAHN